MHLMKVFRKTHSLVWALHSHGRQTELKSGCFFVHAELSSERLSARRWAPHLSASDKFKDAPFVCKFPPKHPYFLPWFLSLGTPANADPSGPVPYSWSAGCRPAPLPPTAAPSSPEHDICSPPTQIYPLLTGVSSRSQRPQAVYPTPSAKRCVIHSL